MLMSDNAWDPGAPATVHGIIMGLAFLVAFPAGALLVRSIQSESMMKIHAAFQLLVYISCLAGLGIGIYLAMQEDKVRAAAFALSHVLRASSTNNCFLASSPIPTPSSGSSSSSSSSLGKRHLATFTTIITRTREKCRAGQMRIYNTGASPSHLVSSTPSLACDSPDSRWGFKWPTQ